MSTRNLEYFFRPRSVALIGASEKPASVGATVLANLISAGFKGPIWPINPGYPSLRGLPCYPNIDALPGATELAVIATPAATMPALIEAIGRRGSRAVVVISAGFAKRGTPEGRALHDAALAAARAMRKSIGRERPEARLTGFTVEPMQCVRDGHELIVGAHEDRPFGPVILFGHGGIAVELHDDKAIGLPPLNRELARDLIDRTRVSPLLRGFRGLPPVDLPGMEQVICRVSQRVIELPEVIELDSNPLLAGAKEVCALDVRVHIANPVIPCSGRLASRRMAQIDYDREIVLLLLDPLVAGAASVLGVAMWKADPDAERAGLELVVRRVIEPQQVAWPFDRLITAARLRGIDELHVPAPGDGLLRADFDAAGVRSMDLLDTLAIRLHPR